MSKREDLEARIKEQRVLEANKKGLVGFSGKIGSVLKAFGSEIVSHESESIVPLFEEIPEEPRNAKELMSYIPTVDVEGSSRPDTAEWGEAGETHFASTRKIGMHFDGLSRGMHMEIKYDDEKSELSLTYKGYLAYRETMGDLDVYVPNEEWEGWIERLWSLSKKIQRQNKELEFKKKAEEADRAKEEWWVSLRKRWGII